MSLLTIRNPILRDLGLDSGSSLVSDVKVRILDYINEAIESVLNQTYQDFELLIINDCSYDNSFKIIKSFSSSKINLML